MTAKVAPLIDSWSLNKALVWKNVLSASINQEALVKVFNSSYS